MTLGEYHTRKIPEYYPTMYLDGYTPNEILYSAQRSIYNKYLERNQKSELNAILNQALDEILKDWK